MTLKATPALGESAHLELAQTKAYKETSIKTEARMLGSLVSSAGVRPCGAVRRCCRKRAKRVKRAGRGEAFRSSEVVLAPAASMSFTASGMDPTLFSRLSDMPKLRMLRSDEP